MMQRTKLKNPIMIAAWPGMGHVAMTACYYMISKLKMEFRAEYAASELFDVDHVVIESGLVQPFRYPKNQVFVWRNEKGENDIMIFIGEAQPPTSRYDFCRKLIDFAQREGVTEVYTFAAMATDSELGAKSRVVGAATDEGTMLRFAETDVKLLKDGSISGMNGILLGVAAERKLPGGCLLGEMPFSFINVPFPTASLAVLESFKQLVGMELDTTALANESKRIEAYLSQMMDQIKMIGQQQAEPTFEEYETYHPDPAETDKLTPEDKNRIEALFFAAQDNRAAAFDLKTELDRLGVFREYENRFLDLFKGKTGPESDLEDD